MSEFVSIEVRGDDCFVIAHGRTSTGMFSQSGFFRHLRAEEDDATLGAAAREVLASPMPATDELPTTSVAQQALKIRSYSTYLAGAISVYLDVPSPLVVRLTPTRNQGPRGGFVEIRGSDIEVSDPSDAALGSAIRAALASAE